MENYESVFPVGGLEVVIKSSVDGVNFDSQVFINGAFLCCISGKDRFDFIEMFRLLLEKYAI